MGRTIAGLGEAVPIRLRAGATQTVTYRRRTRSGTRSSPFTSAAIVRFRLISPARASRNDGISERTGSYDNYTNVLSLYRLRHGRMPL